MSILCETQGVIVSECQKASVHECFESVQGGRIQQDLAALVTLNS
jgi:hypothetical protein